MDEKPNNLQKIIYKMQQKNLNPNTKIRAFYLDYNIVFK